MSHELGRLKQALGLGFGGNVVAEVEAQTKVINDLKTALGLPRDASLKELQEKIYIIKTEHEEFMEKKGAWEGRSTGFWQKLFGSK